jgi:hypothetical protein
MNDRSARNAIGDRGVVIVHPILIGNRNLSPGGERQGEQKGRE